MLVLAIVSIMVSGVFGFIGVWFSKKSGKNLEDLRKVADRIENNVLLNRENIEKVVSLIIRYYFEPVIKTATPEEVATIETSIKSSTEKITNFFTEGAIGFKKSAGGAEDIQYYGEAGWLAFPDNSARKNGPEKPSGK
ncbi:MAG: hypothetical protein JXQ30_14165 [Spirochaetes bacterium]|nr:hypothetical protein [Spirochaetota bacterium]